MHSTECLDEGRVRWRGSGGSLVGEGVGTAGRSGQGPFKTLSNPIILLAPNSWWQADVASHRWVLFFLGSAPQARIAATISLYFNFTYPIFRSTCT